MRTLNLCGARFGRWTVLSKCGVDSKGRVLWHCRCDCGNETRRRTGDLNSGRTLSCGCLAVDQVRQRLTKHGHAARGELSSEYRSWRNMHDRCKRNPRYVGRVTICERWQSFENFLADMGRKPTPRHSIDRIDPFGHYTPTNCRWATARVQRQNQQSKINCGKTKAQYWFDTVMRGEAAAEI
jgi:hypothetical protein